jgi:DNA/RNA-binding domain of Phe-tRNA-synthetase-like protein
MGAMPLALSLSPEIAGRVQLGVLLLEGVSVKAADESLAEAIDAYGRELRQRYGQARSAELPGAPEARELYKALGLDPTKTRPSSEALARRVLKGEALYRINTLVDALNLCSLRAQLPFGLYDQAQVVPPVVLRFGAPGEAYEGIRKGDVHVEGRPVLADAVGAFGNPSSDSARTMVTERTRSALVTVYAPIGYNRARLTAILDETSATLRRFCGGEETDRTVLA